MNERNVDMMPGIGASPAHDIRPGSHYTGGTNLDTKIVILSVITIFINAYLCAAVALLATAYALSNKEKRLRIASIPHVRWIFLFSILLFAIPPIYSNWLGLAAGLAIFVILVFYLYINTNMAEGLYNAVIDISCLISLVYVLIALFQRLLGVAPRSPSTFRNANYYSYALELVMMMSFYRLSTAKTLAHKAFIILVVAANALAIWTADSRSAWPSIFCGLAVLFALNRQTRSLLMLIGIYAIGIKLALTYPSVLPRLSSLEFAEDIRTDIWMQALLGIRQHLLFGAGAMGFYHITGGPYYHSHDLLLELLLSFGLVGAFFILAFFTLTFTDMAKRFKTDGRNRIYALIFASVAVTAVHGIADVTVMWPQTGMLLALILAGGGVKTNAAELADGKAVSDAASPTEPES